SAWGFKYSCSSRTVSPPSERKVICWFIVSFRQRRMIFWNNHAPLPKAYASLYSLQIEVRVQRLVARQHERPVFGVVIRVDDGKDEMMQVCRLCATRNIDEIKLHTLLVRRLASHHPRPVARFAVVN